MTLSCSCEDFDKGDVEQWVESTRRRVPPPGATCCECDAPLPVEKCLSFDWCEVYKPDVETPPHPDDVLALSDKAFPCRFLTIYSTQDGLYIAEAHPDSRYGLSYLSYGPTRPLAILLALLRAMQAREEVAT